MRKELREFLFPNACSSRGADMGRRDLLPDAGPGVVRCWLRRVRAVDGDYDPGGAYWGSVAGDFHGALPLWVAWNRRAGLRVFVRAPWRVMAAALVVRRCHDDGVSVSVLRGRRPGHGKEAGRAA